jgi:cytidylate kinase
MPAFVITVSGTPLSGKTTIARKLCEELKFEYFSPAAFYSQNERLQKGGVVVDHIYAAAGCHDKIDTFNVLLGAPVRVRARRLMKREKITDDIGAVEEFLLQKEEREFEIGRSMHRCDYRYPGFYNVSLETGNLGIEKELAIILRAYNVYSKPQAPAEAEVY